MLKLTKIYLFLLLFLTHRFKLNFAQSVKTSMICIKKLSFIKYYMMLYKTDNKKL